MGMEQNGKQFHQQDSKPKTEENDEIRLNEIIKHIAMAGIGTVVDAVEKSRDALASFASSEKTKEWVQKGEEAVQSVAEADVQACQKMKSAVSDLVEFKDRDETKEA
jgi:4-hydroxy-3-methylbut-2-en-1-yl diphosphate synthase IspG/GcpE